MAVPIRSTPSCDGASSPTWCRPPATARCAHACCWRRAGWGGADDAGRGGADIAARGGADDAARRGADDTARGVPAGAAAVSARAPGVLARGPWRPEQVEAVWREDAYEPSAEI